MVAAVFLCAGSAGAAEFQGRISAKSAILVDAESGRVLFEKNADERSLIASTTKIMTCVLALETGNPEDVLPVSSYAARQPKVHMGVQKGEHYRMEDLLYGLMLESYNDVAVVIAEYYGSKAAGLSMDCSLHTEEESRKAVLTFARKMNEKAKEIGCENTFFITPNGLDAELETDGTQKQHSCTATDLAAIMRYCAFMSPQKETFLTITRTASRQFYSLKKAQDGSTTPDEMTFKAYYRDGTNSAKVEYQGIFVVEESKDGKTWTKTYESSSVESSLTYSFYNCLEVKTGDYLTTNAGSMIVVSKRSMKDVLYIRCRLYTADKKTILDEESIPLVMDVEALTHEQIFNLLTNNGAWQGIYRGSDGKLYINFSYGRGGTLNLGGKADTYGDGELHVYNYFDKEVVTIDNKGIIVLNYSLGISADEKPISYVCITPDVFGGIYISENKDGTGACAILSPDEIILKNNSSGPLIVQTDITMHMTDESLYLGSISEYKFHFGKERSSFYQPVTIGGSLSVTGEKNRIIDTENYDTRKQYCYETATPYFGDIGTAQTDDKGKCYIDIDDIFSETVNTGVEYQVFLQKEGQGDLWVEEKTDSYFVVRGTENLKFSWEIKAIQRDYEFERLEKFDNSEKEEVIDYEKEYMEEINDLIKEQEEMLNETVE